MLASVHCRKGPGDACMTVASGPLQRMPTTDPGLLRIKGDCSMSDLATLERSLSQWRDAGPRRIDLTAAGEFDIGPAWLYPPSSARSRSARHGRRRGGRPAAAFRLPRLNSLARTTPTTRRQTKPAATRGWSRFGRAIEARGRDLARSALVRRRRSSRLPARRGARCTRSACRRSCATPTRPACRPCRSSR